MDIVVSSKNIASPFNLLVNTNASQFPTVLVLRSWPGLRPEEKAAHWDFIKDLPNEEYSIHREGTGEEYAAVLDGAPTIKQEHRTWIEFQITFKLIQ